MPISKLCLVLKTYLNSSIQALWKSKGACFYRRPGSFPQSMINHWWSDLALMEGNGPCMTTWHLGLIVFLSLYKGKRSKQLQSFDYGPGIDQAIDFFLKYCEESLNYGHLTHEEYWGSKVMKCPAQGFPLGFWGGMFLSVSHQLLHTLMIRLGAGGGSDR